MSLTLDRLASIAIVSSGGNELDIDGDGYITAKIDGEVTVNASDLDIRDLTHVSDTVGIGDGTNLAAVNASLELQVRDDDANTLLGTIDADTSALAGTVDGTELQVDIVASLPAGDNNIGNVDVLSMPGIYVEDEAAAGGENGMFALGMRQDADTSPVSADGDYHGLVFNDKGQLKIAGDINVTEDSYSTIKATAESVGVAAAEIVSTPLAARKSIMLQNNGSSPIFIGPTGVTVATGIEIGKNSTMEFKADVSLDLFAISSSAAQDLRCFEMGA